MFLDLKFFSERALRDVSATTDQAYSKDAGAHTNGLFKHIESKTTSWYSDQASRLRVLIALVFLAKIAGRIGSVAQLVRAHP